VEAVEGAFGGDIDYAMLIKMFGAAPEAAKGGRPGGFGGDPSIFAPCSLDISKRAKQAVGNKDLQSGDNARLPGRSRQPSSPSGAFLEERHESIVRARIAPRDLGGHFKPVDSIARIRLRVKSTVITAGAKTRVQTQARSSPRAASNSAIRLRA
jgi:hypothetical protein